MKIDIVRAWKDEAYRRSLSPEEQAMLPENPAGVLELSDAELQVIHGGNSALMSVLCSVLCHSIACGSFALC
jgi:mersacidin/lichenicidin family type 2 lantibiotic